MKPKLKAFLVHLAITAAVVCALLWTFIGLLWPRPYFMADGGWQGLRLVLAVDLVVGPLLTFVVFDPRKSRRSLVLDYAVIACLQLVALALGLWTTYAHRTRMAIFADGSFYTVDAEAAARIGGNAPRLLGVSAATPVLALVRMPEDENGRQRLRKEALSTGVPLYARGELLEPLDARSFTAVLEREVDVVAVTRGKPAQREELDRFLQSRGGPAAAFVFVPLICRYESLALAFDRATGRPAGWLWIALPKAAGLRLGRLRGASSNPP